MFSKLTAIIIVSGFATLCSASDRMDKQTFAEAQAAIRLKTEKKEEDAALVFGQFSKNWQRVVQEGRFNKALYLQAAKCFYEFQEPDKAILIITQVIEKSGRSLPPDAPYLLVKSLHQKREYSKALKELDRYATHLNYLSTEKQQETAMIGAAASSELGKMAKAKAFLERVLVIDTDTETAKAAREKLATLTRQGQPEEIEK